MGTFHPGKKVRQQDPADRCDNVNKYPLQADESGLAVGTNDIRAATLHLGDERTIRAKNAKYLTFKVGGQWRRAASVRISIQQDHSAFWYQ